MTREEAIKLIDDRMCYGRGKWSEHHMPEIDEYWKAGQMAIKALEEPQWILCSERLPEEKAASYWVCTDAGYQFECRWTNVNHLFTNLTMKWHWHVMDVPQYSMVVAWKPLPEPYKGEDTKNEL